MFFQSLRKIILNKAKFLLWMGISRDQGLDLLLVESMGKNENIKLKGWYMENSTMLYFDTN